MQTLQAFLEDTSGDTPARGQLGHLTDWLPFCSFTLASGTVCVCDPAFSPPEADMHVSLQLPPGEYRVEGRGIFFGSDRRTSTLRCVRRDISAVEPGKTLGEVGVDTGRIGFCDEKVFGGAIDQLGEDAFIDALEETGSGAIVFEPAPGAILPFVDSGFGDGNYEVTELRTNSERVGFELDLIPADKPYPFQPSLSETEESSALDEQKHKDAVKQMGMLQEMLAKLSEKRTGNKEADKETFKNAMQEMMQEQENILLDQGEEFRAHLVAQRKVLPVIRTSTRPGPADILVQPEVHLRRTALESAGYHLQGVHEFVGISGFALLLFGHSSKGTIATISCGKDLSTELAAYYPDRREFYVRDTAASPGITPPPWTTYLYESGKNIPDLIAIFESQRPPGHFPKTSTEIAADLANEFHRIQDWRMERGGWNRDEVQAQLGITDPVAQQEQLDDACLNIREKWLYTWFKHHHPNIADRLIDRLVIIHDELDSSLLMILWRLVDGSSKVRRHQFENGSPRQAFRDVNEAEGQPLKRIGQKFSGFPADFYQPV